MKMFEKVVIVCDLPQLDIALAMTRQPYTALGILDAIEQSAVAFEVLAARLVGGYEQRRQPLLESAARARSSLAAEASP